MGRSSVTTAPEARCRKASGTRSGYRAWPPATRNAYECIAIKGARLTVYPAAPHGITDTHKQQLGDDLLAFLKEYQP